MWHRVPPPCVYRRQPALLCGVISPPSQTMCSGSIRTLGGHLIRLFYIPSGTEQDGRLNAMTVPTECRSSLQSPLRRPQTWALLCCAARCSRGTCSLYTNPPGAQPLLQPQSLREAITRYLHCLVFLTYTGTVLTTLFCPTNLGFGLFLSEYLLYLLLYQNL